MNPYVLRKRIAAEVQDWLDGAGLQVDAIQGAESVVDEDGVKLLSGGVDQHILLPASVGLYLAVPFSVFVEGEGIAFQHVAFGVEDESFVVDEGE